MRTGVDKQRRVPSLCVRVRACVDLPLALWFGEGCVKIMQMRNEFEIKDGLITPVLSIWLHLGGSMVNHVLPTEKKKKKALQPVGQHTVLYCSVPFQMALSFSMKKAAEIKYTRTHFF